MLIKIGIVLIEVIVSGIGVSVKVLVRILLSGVIFIVCRVVFMV